jgi:hypothetical protein
MKGTRNSSNVYGCSTPIGEVRHGIAAPRRNGRAQQSTPSSSAGSVHRATESVSVQDHDNIAATALAPIPSAVRPTVEFGELALG